MRIFAVLAQFCASLYLVPLPYTKCSLQKSSNEFHFEPLTIIHCIAGFQCHAIQTDRNKNQNLRSIQIKSRIWEMKGCYTKALAKIQVIGIFRIRDRKKYFPQNLQRFVWRRHAGAHLDELQHGGRKPTETSVTEFCYKSVNLFFEKLKNIKVILFLIHELFRQQNVLI